MGNGEIERARSGEIFSVQRFSVHDGPGIRSTVFFAGCPLRCSWCHNPESQRAIPGGWTLSSRCLSCGACQDACSTGAVARVDGAGCTLCGDCVDACPTGARQPLRRRVGVEEVLEEALADIDFFARSGGGVTFSGGEPLSQTPFLLSCLEELARRDVHRVVDTCGFAPRAALLAVSELTDLLLFDVKAVDDDRHRALTGVPASPILENLAALDARGVEIWIRVPLVPGANDDAEELERIASTVSKLRSTRRVHLLPYHEIGADKYQRLGRDVTRFRAPSDGELETARALFQSYDLEVSVGG